MPPLLPIAVAWLLGLAAAHHWLTPLGIAPASLALLCLLPAATGFLWRDDARVRLGSACALVLLLGAVRYQAALPQLDHPAHVAYYNDQGMVRLTGVVRGYPDERDTYTLLRVEAEALEIEGVIHEVHGLVQVQAPRYPENHYGDRLQVSGKLETPPLLDDMDYRAYLARKGIHAQIRFPQIVRLEPDQGSPVWQALYTLKDRARDAIARLMPEPASSLLQGILLGLRAGIPQGLYDDFVATGASHVLVISGANITIVAALFSQVFGRILGKRRAYSFTVAGIVVYVLLVGADAAVVRAGLMGILWVTALHLGRTATAYVSLLASAWLLTLIWPLSLWDVGFQLSFAATLSLILFVAPLERLLERGLSRWVSPENARLGVHLLSQVLVVTVAAQILTLPLIVYHFGRLSTVSLLVNLLILPAQAPIMIGGGLAAIMGLVPALEGLAQILFYLPWLFLTYTSAVVRWLASWSQASLEIGHGSALGLALYYVMALTAAWLLRRPSADAGTLSVQRSTTPTATRWLMGGSVLTLVLLGLATTQLPDGRLHVAFLDVGQGDAILITTPRGQQVLVDGGPSPSALTAALGSQMPFWDRSLDLVVMTHPDADHITGLVPVLERFQVGAWADSGRSDSDRLYEQCLTRLDAQKLQPVALTAGDRFDLGDGIRLEVLHPAADVWATDANDDSVVLRLTWHQASFLLTGDVATTGEQAILASGQPLDATVLKVAHHGSNGSTGAPFLAAVQPQFAVLSVGADNRYGHPAPELLQRLTEQDSLTILRTDHHGTVEFVTDGQRLWIQTERWPIDTRFVAPDTAPDQGLTSRAILFIIYKDYGHCTQWMQFHFPLPR